MGRVALVLRGRRLIPMASGRRECFKQAAAWLSARNLTWGAAKEAVRQKLIKRGLL